MRIVLVAPGLGAPWTEGRKNLVRDIARELIHNHEVTTITTGNQDLDDLAGQMIRTRAPTRALAVLFLVLSVARHLRGNHYDLCLYFPYGTFDRSRRLANEWSISAIRRIARDRSILFRTVLYSIEGHPSKTKVLASGDVLAADCVPADRQIPLGISTQDWPEITMPQSSDGRLLFLAGMTNPKELNHVMDKRGLGVVLLAGSLLAEQGFTLHVAVPFLGEPSEGARILESPHNNWPEGTVRVGGTVEIPEVFLESDILVFAYTKEIQAFRPTSVMEAMMAGRPVVLPDHAWLRRQVPQGMAEWFAPSDPSDLCRAVVRTRANYEEYARAVAEHAKSGFQVVATLDAIFAHLSD